MSISKMQYNASDILNYPANHHNPTTQTNYANNVKNWVETEKSLVDTILWQPTTAYSVGNIVKTPSLPSQYCLVCTTAGTSGANEPSYNGKTIGSSVTDGSVTWTVKEVLPQEVLPQKVYQVRLSSAQSVANNTNVALGTQVTIPKGTYVVCAFGGFMTGTTATGIRKAGFVEVTSSSSVWREVTRLPGYAEDEAIDGTGIFGFSTNTNVKFFVYQNSGSSVNVIGGVVFLRISNENLL
jgi:hypothetical protein